MSTIKKAFRFLLLFFLIFAIISLLQNNIGLINRGLIVRKEQQNLNWLEGENRQLKAKLDYVKSEEFLEQEARNSLGLTRKESILILPSDFNFWESEKNQNGDKLSVWRQWWIFLFN